MPILDAPPTVFAAASLREALRSMVSSLPNPPRLVFAGSQALVAQIKAGSKVDVLFSAGLEPLRGLKDFSEPRMFATNRMVLITPLRSTVHTFRDLSGCKRIVLADRSVPAGDYALKVLTKAESKLGKEWRAEVGRQTVSKEVNVRVVLRKVELGEADAGIVYQTDVPFAKVRPVSIPDELNVLASYYWVSRTTEGKKLGEWFSQAGAITLRKMGFGIPAPSHEPQPAR